MAAIGSNELKISKALHPFKKYDQDEVIAEKIHTGKAVARDESLLVQGVGNLLTNLASCCQPVPGDAIVGYITTSRGISIHRSNCVNMVNL